MEQDIRDVLNELYDTAYDDGLNYAEYEGDKHYDMISEFIKKIKQSLKEKFFEIYMEGGNVNCTGSSYHGMDFEQLFKELEL